MVNNLYVFSLFEVIFDGQMRDSETHIFTNK